MSINRDIHFVPDRIGILRLYEPVNFDNVWRVIFSLGGIFIMVGHQIFDQKIKHSFWKIVWMVVTSMLACFLIKILYDEKEISMLTMIISTLVVSMIAPATISLALNDLPGKIADQLNSLPEFVFNLLKKKFDKDGDA